MENSETSPNRRNPGTTPPQLDSELGESLESSLSSLQAEQDQFELDNQDNPEWNDPKSAVRALERLLGKKDE